MLMASIKLFGKYVYIFTVLTVIFFFSVKMTFFYRVDFSCLACELYVLTLFTAFSVRMSSY